MNKIFLFLLGFIPFGLGFLMNKLIMQINLLPLALISIVFLLFWGFIGFFARKLKEGLMPSLAIVNLPAFLMLLLILYQEIILKQYFSGFLGICAQLYFFPVLNIAFALTSWSISLWISYIAGFLLMCIAFYSGYKFKDKPMFSK